MGINKTIEQQIADNAILLYMKGSAESPLCGFSARVVQALEACGAQYSTIDVLADPELRDGVKQYSNWPTFPQLYIKGELIGGCDIVMELYSRGELQKMLRAAVE